MLLTLIVSSINVVDVKFISIYITSYVNEPLFPFGVNYLYAPEI